MRQISEGIYGLLVSQGLANAKPVGAGKVRGMKGRGAASDGARSQGLADAPMREGTRHRPTAGGGLQPMGMGKGAPAETGASQQQEVGKRHTDPERGTGRYRTNALRLIVNPNMSGMPMRQTTQTPRAVAPRGVVSLMVITNDKP